MIANFYERGGKKKKEKQEEGLEGSEETEGFIPGDEEDIEVGEGVELKNHHNLLENDDDDDMGITVSVDRITPVKK